MTTVSRATFDDFLAIARLDRIAWGENNHSEFIPDGEHAWRLWVEHALVFKAVTDGAISGAILAFPCMDGRYCIHKVFTDPLQRRQGIGTLLFNHLLDELDAMRVASFLTVDPANEAALALYERWGYVERTFVKGYYREYEDRFVLTKPAV